MNLFYAAAIAAIMGCGMFLLLSRHIVRIVFGVMFLASSINLTIFLAGRLGFNAPPVIRAGETVLEAGSANPLPQALALTAIVIGFSLVAFVTALVLQTYRAIGTLDSRELDQAERLGSPDEDEDERE